MTSPVGPGRTSHFLVSFLGTFGDANAPLERWQTSLRVNAIPADATAFTAAQLVAKATTLHASFATNIINISQAGTSLTAVDIRFIGANGLQPRDTQGAFQGAGRYEQNLGTTASGTPLYPFQIAVVASLQTARAGARGKGRLFLPPPFYILDSSGRLSVANVATYAGRVSTIINAVNTEFTPGRRVSVMSTWGVQSEVTSVKVGKVLDTHRSRRTSQLEAYSPNSAVALPGA